MFLNEMYPDIIFPDRMFLDNTITRKPDKPTNIDCNKLVHSFLREYYKGVSNEGWNAVTHLFDPSCTIIVRDKVVGNVHGLLDVLSRNYIKRANYGRINSKWMSVSGNSVVVNIFGHIQFISFNGYNSVPFIFSETFLLKLENRRLTCHNHMLDF